MLKWLVFVFIIATLLVVDCGRQVRELVCVPITECPVFLQLLKKRPLATDSLRLLYASRCGYENNIEKVWCLHLNNQSTLDTNSKLDKIDIDVRNEKTRSTKEDNPKSILPSRKVCGQYIEEKIVGGETTEIDEFPWTALIFYRGDQGNLKPGCGGALITNRHVLTAAHCITRRQAALVVLGEYDVRNETDCVPTADGTMDCSPSPVQVNIAKTIVHENWMKDDRPFYDDIAIIQLERDIPFTDFVAPICLPVDNQSMTTETNFTVTGWGVTENHLPSAIKRKVHLPIVGNGRCSTVWSRTIREGQICAGGLANKDSCKGDSGGPLMYLDAGDQTWTLSGLVSFGPGKCGTYNVPGLYTYIPHYMDWILKNIQ